MFSRACIKGRGLIAKEKKGSLGEGDGNVLCLDCDIGYMSVGVVKTYQSVYLKE